MSRRTEHPPTSARYHRTSLTPSSRSHQGPGLGSSSTKVQVLADNYNGAPERGYDSEAIREAPAPQHSGYHTEGQPSKRVSKDLYRAALDPRRAHGGRLSSMPAAQPQQSSFAYAYEVRPGALDDTGAHGTPRGVAPGMPDAEDSAAEQSSSLRRVKKDKERRHRDRERENPESRTVPASVWMQQVASPPESKPPRTSKRESRSARTRQDEIPQQAQPDLPRSYTQPGSIPPATDYHRHANPTSSYSYAQQPTNSSVPYRPANATPVPPPPQHDYYRPNAPTPALPDHYAPAPTPNPQAQAQLNPRYEYVIDDRAGLRSPPPVEVPHAFPAESTYEYYTPATPALPLPRNLSQLKADGLVPASPVASYRRTHRSARSEDVNPATGVFADGSSSNLYTHADHSRPSLRHQPSRSEDLRKLGLGQAPSVAPDERETLVRPVHVGRSASETIVPQQLPTPAMFGAGLAVTSGHGVPVPGERGGVIMHPQLQESFAESANASRAPVNAAMANAAVHGYAQRVDGGGLMESDSSSAKDVSSRRTMKKEKKPRRASKQSDVVPQQGDAVYAEPSRQAQAEAARQVLEPTPPPVVVFPTGKRPRTTSGKSGKSVVVLSGQDEEHDPDADPDTVLYKSQTPEPVIVDPPPRRASRVSLVGGSLLGSRPGMTFAGAGAALGTDVPRGDVRGDGGNEFPRGQGQVGGVETAPRRGSVVPNAALEGVGERARRPSAGAGAEERSRGIEERARKQSIGAEERVRRSSIGAEERRRIEEERARRQSDMISPAGDVVMLGRRSMESDDSLQTYESAVQPESTVATQDPYLPAHEYGSTRDATSTRDAMSPRSNYFSVAASVRSVVNEATRNLANDVRNMANEVREAVGGTNGTVVMQSPPAAKAMPAPPLAQARQNGVRASVAPSLANGVPLIGRERAAGRQNELPPPPNSAPAKVLQTPMIRPTEVGPAPGPSATPGPKQPIEPEGHGRPRVPSVNLSTLPLGPGPSTAPADIPAHRATIDVHSREGAPGVGVMVDEEGRLSRVPPGAPQTMPVRGVRHSISMQRPRGTSPPPAHAQAQAQAQASGQAPSQIAPPVHSQAAPMPSEAQASSLPRNLQVQQQTGSSKESLVEPSANPKSSKSKSSSRWFWNKNKPSEAPQKAPPPPRIPSPSPAPASAPSSAPPPPPVPQSQRARQTSILGGFIMGNPGSSKSKHKAPEPAPPSGSDIYQSLDSTPSSITLNLEPETVKKDESRMPRMFTTLKNTLRRTPSSAKLGHGFSRSMSRLPGTSREAAAPPPGAPLARSTSVKDSVWPMSPPRAKEPLRPMKDAADLAPPPAPPVAPPVVAPVSPPVVPNERGPAPKELPRAPEVIPTKDMRRPDAREVPIVEKTRAAAPTPVRPAAPVEQMPTSKTTRTFVDASGRLVDSSGRPLVDSAGRPILDGASRPVVDSNGRPMIDSAGRPMYENVPRTAPPGASQRTGAQAPPPLHRAASPPLVSRPVTSTRVPPTGQTNIFTNASAPPRPSTQPVSVPITTHSSSRTQGSRERGTSGGRSSRDPGPISGNLRTPRTPREAAPAQIAEPAPATSGELGLPTPEATPRSSPTSEDVFEGRAAVVQRERERERERDRERSRPSNIVVPPHDLVNAVNQKLEAEQSANGGTLKFVHRHPRAVSIASLEAVTGQEARFRSEASSIRTVTPGPGQTSFPSRDPLMATEDWTELQLQEDMRLTSEKLAARRDTVNARREGSSSGRKRGGLKRDKAGPRKPGVAFDFPGPVIDEDGEDDDKRKADIDLTYELERMKKRYK